MSTPKHVILPAVTPEARERWISLKERCIAPGAFDDFDFVTGLAKTQQLESDVLLTSAIGSDELAIILPYRRIGPYREAILPRFCSTSPVLASRELIQSEDAGLVRSALDFALTRFHRVGLHVAQPLVGVLTHPAWETIPLHTYLFDLGAISDDVTERWSASTRRLYRRNASEYDIEDEDGLARTALELCAEGYRRSGRPLPIDVPAMANFAHRPPGKVESRTFVARARSTGDPHAGLILLYHRDTAFYWIAGSLPGAGMTVLIGHVLEWLRKAGIRYFDFLGANTPSIAEFKRRFGPELHRYQRISASRSRLLDFLLASRQNLRNVIGR